MAKRRLPGRPDLEHLRRQAKTLLAAYRSGATPALEDFRTYHPSDVEPATARLHDAQLVLARSYRFPSWSRLKIAARLCRAIHDNDLSAIERLVRDHPTVLAEGVRGLDTCATWGAPLAYAEYFGRTEAAALLARLSGDEPRKARHESLQYGLEQLSDWFLDDQGRPKRPGVVMNPCELLNADGLEYLLARGAELADERGDPLAPVALLLQTYSRNPPGRHRCLELCGRSGIELPDTPAMAFHRGRIDLLERHLAVDRGLLERRFSGAEIFPPELGCGEGPAGAGLHGTPVEGVTLLHLCGEYDEVEIARWLLERGADPDTPAATDAEGFGGQTALFHTVVTCATPRQQDATIARLLLEAGADPNARASLRKRLRFHADETLHLYRDVTPLTWGRTFHEPALVNQAALRLIEETMLDRN